MQTYNDCKKIKLPVRYFFQKYVEFLFSSEYTKADLSQKINDPVIVWSLEKNFNKWVEAHGGNLENSKWEYIEFTDEDLATLFCLKWG